MPTRPASAMIQAWALAVEPTVFGQAELDGVVVMIVENAKGEVPGSSARFLILERTSPIACVATIRIGCADGKSVLYQIALIESLQAFQPIAATAPGIDKVVIVSVRPIA